MTAPVRDQLLALTPGIPTWLNGVPVTRIPCSGEWFRVGVHEDWPDVRYQTLRLADAVSRVKSGHFPRLKDPPDLRAYYARLRTELDLQRWREALLEQLQRRVASGHGDLPSTLSSGA